MTLFVATRRLEQWARARTARTGATWYARGEQLLDQGDVPGGTAALREAIADDRDNVTYTLALARALARGTQTSEARQLLLRLRDEEPDDIEINYRLARLSADDETTAIRYYTYAIYGVVRSGAALDRRQIRMELIGYLLDHNQTSEAETQLAALGRELPDDAAAQLDAARLAERAGDHQQAYQFFAAAAHLDPKNADAFDGAGEAAFALREFTTADADLARAQQLGAADPALAAHLDVAQLVPTLDPLAPRLGTAGRTDRLIAGMRWATSRYDACVASAGAATDGSDAARSVVGKFMKAPRASLMDPDVVANIVGLIGRLSASADAHCPQAHTADDDAWAIIAAMHGGAA